MEASARKHSNTTAMPDLLQDYLRNVPAMRDDDPRALQKGALAEVLKLSTETVRPVEAQISRQHETALAHAEEKYQQTLRRIEERLGSILAALEKRRQESLQQIDSQFTTGSQNLESSTQAAREAIREEVRTLAGEARREFEHEVWLAETLAESTRGKLRKEVARVRKLVPARLAQLDQLREQADAALNLYGQTPPAADDQIAPAIPDAPASEDSEQDPGRAAKSHMQQAQSHLDDLISLRAPRLFIGGRPQIYTTAICVAGLGLAILLSVLRVPYVPSLAWTGPATLAVCLGGTLLVGRHLRQQSREQIRAAYLPLCSHLAAARVALNAWLTNTEQQLQKREEAALHRRDVEIGRLKERFDALTAEVERRRTASLQHLEEKYTRLREEIDGWRVGQLQQMESADPDGGLDLRQRYENDLATARERHEREIADAHSAHAAARASLESRWDQGLERIRALIDQATLYGSDLGKDWRDASWEAWQPRDSFPPVVCFGKLLVDLGQLAESIQARAAFPVESARPLEVPAPLVLPDRCSLLLETGRSGRQEALRALQAVMARLLTTLPPGRVLFTIVDPVGLGENFAGFMHLADYQESLVGGRIWTDAAHIEERLSDLTTHMENVIQKYLRNEFETIDAYNLQAGELAEPYRFLVIADFPVNFTEEAARRLSSIVASGARCGVHALIAHDSRQSLPPGVQIEDLQARCTHLVHNGAGFVWQDEIYRQFPLKLDEPPVEDRLTRLMQAVGRASLKAKRVEVPFSAITPSSEAEWTGSSRTGLRVPVGRTGATRLQQLDLGKGVAQHVLIAGKTGSGKSTLLHVIITNLALWYSPDEVEFYLVDFKKGVEFKTYVTHRLPHARAVAIESDREFGLSVLQRLDQELTRRGDLFRQAGVQDLAGYREATGERMPRTLLIVDEFQIFFSEDDKLAQDAMILMDRLVRQGRAFGVHVILGSQTLGGTSGLARSTIGQMAVRIALQCSEADSQLILDDDNVAARLLSRPGEAIYNDAGGLVQGNNPFQTAWLPDEDRDACLARVRELAVARKVPAGEPPAIFEGHIPADLAANRPLARLLEAPGWPTDVGPPQAWLGEPVAIKEPTAVAFRRQSGAHLLLVGQRDESATGILAAAMFSLGAWHPRDQARFVILDGTPADSPLAGALARVTNALPHDCRCVDYRDVPQAIAELAAEADRRQSDESAHSPAVYLVVLGLQRYRVLRRKEDDFSFGRSDEDRPPDPGRQFADLLREGPPLGIHVLAWADTPATLDRTLDRQALGEFDNRVLFQMSAADSSNLIDSPAANRLGLYRALFFSEELGLIEKFRPYALPAADWLAQAALRLTSRP